jgi:hypothetical protein
MPTTQALIFRRPDKSAQSDKSPSPSCFAINWTGNPCAEAPATKGTTQHD